MTYLSRLAWDLFILVLLASTIGCSIDDDTWRRYAVGREHEDVVLRCSYHRFRRPYWLPHWPINHETGERLDQAMIDTVMADDAWACPYTGRSNLRREDLTVDHIMSLRDAHDGGGCDWPMSWRRNFATDPANMVVVDVRAWRDKNGRPPPDWMPAINRCWYLRSRRRVAESHTLNLMPAETAMHDECEE